MSTQFPEPERPGFFRLPEETWQEIGRAWRGGATAKALAARYRTSPSTIYRQMRTRGWSKHCNAASSVRARQQAKAAGEIVATPTADASGLYLSPPAPDNGVRHPYGPPAPVFTPDSRYWLDRYTSSELYDPGITAQIAVSASAGALISGNLQDAAVLAQIGYLHARIARLNPQSLREQVFAALTDERARNRLFSRRRHNGEEQLKDEYARWRRQQHDDEQRRTWALQRAEKRVAELEAQIADASCPPPPPPPSQP